ncbi:dnaJ homolog subfamily C member 1-like isoform X2 [Antedon mediterranea]|uniref:dnaJ homolog subfamily C member 1-like isoform X2 n=1 Tax=Antedon mediterranea TaxID=105859 RepID=UPI003AF610EE
MDLKCVVFSFICVLLTQFTHTGAWTTDDLELFDLVEEIPVTFYDFLGIDETATKGDIKKAYRALSLQYHPDKNQEEGAAEKFRKIVAVVEVLKNDELREKYNEILEYGLPTWREPVYYYRKVRKMGLIEMSILVSIIMTVGHYIVAWAAFWEKKFEMECLMPKKKKDKKGKKTKNKEDQEEEEGLTEEMLASHNISRPKFTDLLPLKATYIVFKQIIRIPARLNALRVCIQNRFRRSSEDVEPEEKRRPKRVRTKLETAPIPEPVVVSSGNGPVVYNSVQNGAVENCETTETESRKGKEWTSEEVSKMVRCMAKFPGGTTQRWQKIAAELDRSVDEVLKKSKSMKSGSYAMNVDASVQGIVKGVSSNVTSKTGKKLTDDEISVRNDFETRNGQTNRRNKTAKPPQTAERTLLIKDAKEDEQIVNGDAEEIQSGTWTQLQQKIFETALLMFPKGTSDRFTKVAEQVPEKSKKY